MPTDSRPGAPRAGQATTSRPDPRHQVTGLFFDLYGTLLVYGDMDKAWQEWLDALHRCLNRFAFKLGRETLASACDGFFSRPEPRPRSTELTVYEQRLATVLGELGLAPTPAQLSTLAATSARAWQAEIRLDPEALPVLRSASSRCSLALVSNFDHPPHLLEVLETTGLAPLFDTVVISGEVGVKKPDPRIFAIALDRLGLSPGEVAHVGDADEDVRGAAAASLLPVRILRGSDSRPAPELDFRRSRTDRQRSGAEGARSIRRLAELERLIEAGPA